MTFIGPHFGYVNVNSKKHKIIFQKGVDSGTILIDGKVVERNNPELIQLENQKIDGPNLSVFEDKVAETLFKILPPLLSKAGASLFIADLVQTFLPVPARISSVHPEHPILTFSLD